MPTYEFLCDEDDKGCGEVITITCSASELDKEKPKSCPKCKKRKSIRRVYVVPQVSIPKTLGYYADKNSNKKSADELHHIETKNNEYKKNKVKPWISTENGIVRNLEQ